MYTRIFSLMRYAFMPIAKHAIYEGTPVLNTGDANHSLILESQCICLLVTRYHLVCTPSTELQ